MPDSTPVVLLHGVGLDSSTWSQFEGEWARLSSRACIALDLPGHGDRPALRNAVSLQDLASDVVERMPAGAHLVGFSVGALIAQCIAAHWPERVASLTCVSSVYQRSAEEAAAVGQRLQAAEHDFARSAEASIERWYPDSSNVPQELVEQTRRILHANDVESYLRVYRVFATADQQMADDLDLIRAPTLAVTGERDPGSTVSMTQRLAAAVPDGRLSIIPGARHMLPVERPKELAVAIQHFLDEDNGEEDV